MSFDGPALSIDDEGSILFDGEKFIVNVPADDDLLDHFNPPDNFEVEYTHPSHQQDQQASQGASSLDDNPIFIKEQAQAFNENVRKTRESARNKQSKSDSSRMESRPDYDQAKNDKGAQEALPDFEAAQENYFMAAGSIPNRIPEYCNLDVMRVKQDIETRPLIFQHCFRHSASQQDAMECIYAFPPDCDEDELRYLEQIADQKKSGLSVAMGGDSDTEDDNDLVDFGSQYGLLQEYEASLESKYGIEIKWSKGSYKTNRLQQLQNLDKAIAYIVDYLAREVYDDEQTALEAFKTYFGQSDLGQSDLVKLQIYLGANSETGGAGYGFVPLGTGHSREKLRSMYLGSAVDIPTIVHEFGHVIDRRRGLTLYLEETVPNPAEPSERISRLAAESGNYLNEVNEGWRSQYSFNLNRDVLDLVIEGFVAKKYFAQEIWADLFMTAVLSGEGFVVKSVKDRTRDKDNNIIDDPIAVFETFNDPDEKAPIFECDKDAPCFVRPVQWEDTKFADAAEWYLPKVFLALLSG